MGGMFVRGEGGDVTGYTVTVNICRGFLGIGAVTSVTSVTSVTLVPKRTRAYAEAYRRSLKRPKGPRPFTVEAFNAPTLPSGIRVICAPSGATRLFSKALVTALRAPSAIASAKEDLRNCPSAITSAAADHASRFTRLALCSVHAVCRTLIRSHKTPFPCMPIREIPV